MDDKKRIVEGALFVSARSMGLDELMRLLGVAAPGFVKAILEGLKNEYDERGSAVEIVETGGKWIMQLRGQYADQVRTFAQQAEISRGALRVLAYLSKHDGMLKSDLVKKLGSQVYEKVRELHENSFIKQVRAGRSKRLFLTEKFRQYFKEVQTEGQAQIGAALPAEIERPKEGPGNGGGIAP